MANKILVAYFSASGTTRRAAQRVADAVGADLFEIAPLTPYTKADLDWMNKNSRSSVEMNDRACRPPIAASVPNMADYDAVVVGFPIWWYREPSIIDTFLESYDFSGKKLTCFATSGGSGVAACDKNFKALAPKATLIPGRLLNRAGDDDIKAWLAALA